jgi:O-antigen/teichoic acid export membrane protein
LLAFRALKSLPDIDVTSLHLPVIAPLQGAMHLGIAACIGAFSSQLDRLFVSNSFSPIEVGYYMIAATLSLAVMQMAYPISSAFIPLLSNFHNTASAKRLMWKIYVYLISILCFIWFCVTFFLGEILIFWIASADAVIAISGFFKIHLIGTSLNILCIPLYLTLLAKKWDATALYASLIALFIQLIFLGIGAYFFGIHAAPYAWIAYNSCYLIALIYKLVTDSWHRSCVSLS